MVVKIYHTVGLARPEPMSIDCSNRLTDDWCYGYGWLSSGSDWL